MLIKKILILLTYSLDLFPTFNALSLAENFKATGYLEIYDESYDQTKFNLLYKHFDDLIELLQTNPHLLKKLNYVKERFIRSKNKAYYSTDFFGFYDESKSNKRAQVAFYYSSHFHDFICDNYSEFKQASQLVQFLDTCSEIQKLYNPLFIDQAIALGLDHIFASQYNKTPILFKVVKYLPAYSVSTPHYDGTVFSLFLNSTNPQALILSPYKQTYQLSDFTSPVKQSINSIFLIPGTLLTEYGIYPTPHLVTATNETRYAAIAFAMRPNYSQQKNTLSLLPDFKSLEYLNAN